RRQRPRPVLYCARAYGHCLGSRRLVERPLDCDVRRALSHGIPAVSRRQGGDSQVADRSKVPGSAVAKPGRTLPGKDSRVTSDWRESALNTLASELKCWTLSVERLFPIFDFYFGINCTGDTRSPLTENPTRENRMSSCTIPSRIRSVIFSLKAAKAAEFGG